MRFSIIIPTYNAAEKLSITLDSLTSQTCTDYEVFIMDGNSSDHTCHLASTYQNKIKNYHLLSEKDSGIYDAMNKGVKQANGEYILFLGSGDSLFSDDILEQLDTQLKSKSPDLLYGDICRLGNIVKQPNTLTNRFFSSGHMICHQSILAKRELLLNHPFSLAFRFGADRDWLISSFRNGASIHYVPLPIANFDTTGYSSLPQHRKAVWMESGYILKQYYGFFMVPVTFIKYHLIIRW